MYFCSSVLGFCFYMCIIHTCYLLLILQIEFYFAHLAPIQANFMKFEIWKYRIKYHLFQYAFWIFLWILTVNLKNCFGIELPYDVFNAFISLVSISFIYCFSLFFTTSSNLKPFLFIAHLKICIPRYRVITSNAIHLEHIYWLNTYHFHVNHHINDNDFLYWHYILRPLLNIYTRDLRI